MKQFHKGTNGGWEKYPNNPVLGQPLGTCFDISMLTEEGRFVMYFSWRDRANISRTVSYDGIHWETPQICIEPQPTPERRENHLNRPSVIVHDGVYYMWYTSQLIAPREGIVVSDIYAAQSSDGIHFSRIQEEPVLRPELPWEKEALMCPSVIWDPDTKLYRMWYSGGERSEPNAIGYAESPDGIHWSKHPANPVFAADPRHIWENHKTTACQVLKEGEWYWMFYIGFHTDWYGQIGIARSKNGIDGWERSPLNPIIAPDEDVKAWDGESCYKPFVLYDAPHKCWRLWYNGRVGSLEQIGMATYPYESLKFE